METMSGSNVTSEEKPPGKERVALKAAVFAAAFFFQSIIRIFHSEPAPLFENYKNKVNKDCKSEFNFYKNLVKNSAKNFSNEMLKEFLVFI